jgi:hypothetical protein
VPDDQGFYVDELPVGSAQSCSVDVPIPSAVTDYDIAIEE